MSNSERILGALDARLDDTVELTLYVEEIRVQFARCSKSLLRDLEGTNR
jgi:hypothetical protein